MVATALLQARSSPGGTPLVLAVDEVMRSVHHALQPALEAEGISMGQFKALHIASSQSPVSLSSVARHLAVSAPTACVSIDALEAAGLLTRRRSERDHRTVDLALTPKGRRVEARVWDRIGRLIEEAAEPLSADDVTTAVRVFRELARRLGPTGGVEA
jgi:MarR family transcriptional regulator, organic hydroperoxide resistance regulator